MQSSIKCYNCDFKQLVPIGKDVVAFHELSYCVDQPDRSIRATKSQPPQKCHLYNAPSSVSKPSFGVGNQPDKLRSGETSFRYILDSLASMETFNRRLTSCSSDWGTGYNFVHNPRKDRTGGGVGLYLADNFDFKCRPDLVFSCTECAESLWKSIGRKRKI